MITTSGGNLFKHHGQTRKYAEALKRVQHSSKARISNGNKKAVHWDGYMTCEGRGG